MHFGIRIGKFHLKTWVWIFLLIQVLLLLLIVCCLANPKWIYSDFDFELVLDKDNFSKLECGVIYCFHPRSISYCQLSKEIDLDDYRNSEYENAKSFKSMITSLNQSGKIAVIFYSISVFALAFWFTTIILLLKNFNVFWYSWISSIISCAFFWIGSCTWFALTPSKFISCNSIPDKGSTAIPCSSTGPILCIVIMILFQFITLLYLIISIKAYRRRHRNVHNDQNRITVNTSPILDSNRNSLKQPNPESPLSCVSPEITLRSPYRARGFCSLYEQNFNEIYDVSPNQNSLLVASSKEKLSSSQKVNFNFGFEVQSIPTTLVLNKQISPYKDNSVESERKSKFFESLNINYPARIASNKFRRSFEDDDEMIIYDDEIIKHELDKKNRYAETEENENEVD